MSFSGASIAVVMLVYSAVTIGSPYTPGDCEIPSYDECSIKFGDMVLRNGAKQWNCFSVDICNSFINAYASANHKLMVRIRKDEPYTFAKMFEIINNLGIPSQPNPHQSSQMIQFIQNTYSRFPKTANSVSVTTIWCFVNKWWDNKQPFDFVADGIECGLQVIQNPLTFLQTSLSLLFDFYEQQYMVQLSITDNYIEYQFDYMVPN